MKGFKHLIEEAHDIYPELLSEHRQSIFHVIDQLDQGQLRVAELTPQGWITHAWIKKAILLYFRLQKMNLTECPPFQYADKIPLKKWSLDKGVRVVPPATQRYGSYIAPQSVLMPSYINIGAYVDSGTMVDTWATVGSCAQIGKNVHLSGGVGIGGVLEPPQASPVIIEDDVFIGSRAVIVEGVRVEREAVIGAGVILTQSTKIVDVSGEREKILTGVVPPRSVVIPGSREKVFPSGRYQVPCALIIGQRKPSTDLKTSLNEVLRQFEIPV